jgi:hypothetical protein
VNILFLDFDGVLHPASVFLREGRPTLVGPGKLFMWASVLDTLLLPYPDVRIVLSTSWCVHRGFARAKGELPPGLSGRVIGSTWHSRMTKAEFLEKPRFHQILEWLARSPRRPRQWLAIDDDDVGWAETNRDLLVHTDPHLGLSASSTVVELTDKLQQLVR